MALEWATLDVISGGRTILGPCMGNPEKGVEREFEALGLPFKKRGYVLEEVLEVVRTLWTEGKVSFHGDYFDYDEVGFHSGTEMAPLGPLQTPPPIWVVSNPRLVDDSSDERMMRIMKRACRRIIRYGDGWMTCCRAEHPEELTEQIGYLEESAKELDRDFGDYEVAYQVTMNIADSEAEAKAAFDGYISKYYPELSQAMDLSNWGPVGTPDQIAEWLKEFAARQHLNFPLLSDFFRTTIEQYGVAQTEGMFKGIPKRAVFVLDGSGIVRHKEITANPGVEPDYGQVFAALDRM